MNAISEYCDNKQIGEGELGLFSLNFNFNLTFSEL